MSFSFKWSATAPCLDDFDRLFCTYDDKGKMLKNEDSCSVNSTKASGEGEQL